MTIREFIRQKVRFWCPKHSIPSILETVDMSTIEVDYHIRYRWFTLFCLSVFLLVLIPPRFTGIAPVDVRYAYIYFPDRILTLINLLLVLTPIVSLSNLVRITSPTHHIAESWLLRSGLALVGTAIVITPLVWLQYHITLTPYPYNLFLPYPEIPYLFPYYLNSIIPWLSLLMLIEGLHHIHLYYGRRSHPYFAWVPIQHPSLLTIGCIVSFFLIFSMSPSLWSLTDILEAPFMLTQIYLICLTTTSLILGSIGRPSASTGISESTQAPKMLVLALMCLLIALPLFVYPLEIIIETQYFRFNDLPPDSLQTFTFTTNNGLWTLDYYNLYSTDTILTITKNQHIIATITGDIPTYTLRLDQHATYTINLTNTQITPGFYSLFLHKTQPTFTPQIASTLLLISASLITTHHYGPTIKYLLQKGWRNNVD